MSRTVQRRSVLLLLASSVEVLAAGVQAQGAPTELRIDREVGARQELALEVGQNRLLILSEQIGRVAVADPSVADLKVVTQTQILLTAKGVGATDLTFWNKENRPLVIALHVTRNLDALRKQLKEIFPGEQINVSAAGELVVLTGQVSDVRMPERIAEVAKLHAKEIANLVQVTGNQQVQIEVRFAEVSRTGLREIGVNLFHKRADGNLVGGMTAPGSPPSGFLPIPGTGAAGVNGQPPEVLAPAFANAFSLFFSERYGFPLSGMLSLLEENGLAKVLAEPTLVTLSGQEAKFLAGGEFPIPLSSALGQVSVQWKKFGILLGFTPTVIAGDTIHLHLAAEVSDIDPTVSINIAGLVIPGLSSRQSETTVRLGDGQSFAIAGLLSDKVRSTIDRVPGLGSIPVLGALFRSIAFRRQETELLVVVTARLAKPLAPHEVPPLPTDYEVNDPDDLSLFLLGMEGVPARPPPGGDMGGATAPSGQRGFVR